MKNNSPETSDLDRIDGDTPLTPEELTRYKELISMSYPRPKRSVSDGVIAEIKQASARKRMNRILRYGGIAACFVLILGVAVSIIPIINGASKTEENDVWSFASKSLEAQDIALTGFEAPAEKDANSYISDQSLTADDLTEAVPNEEYKAEAEATLTETPELTDTTDDALKLNCSKHPAEMHLFPQKLTDCVGTKAFNEWYSSPSALDDCGIPSIRTFVLHFGISSQQITEIGMEYGIDYPLELIFGSQN